MTKRAIVQQSTWKSGPSLSRLSRLSVLLAVLYVRGARSAANCQLKFLTCQQTATRGRQHQFTMGQLTACTIVAGCVAEDYA